MTNGLVDDDLWARIEPLLPKRRRRDRQYAGRKPIPDRAALTGILFVLRSGDPVEHAAARNGRSDWSSHGLAGPARHGDCVWH
jgi:transposase